MTAFMHFLIESLFVTVLFTAFGSVAVSWRRLFRLERGVHNRKYLFALSAIIANTAGLLMPFVYAFSPLKNRFSVEHAFALAAILNLIALLAGVLGKAELRYPLVVGAITASFFWFLVPQAV